VLFYVATFPDSQVTAVLHAPGDYPNGHQGDVLLVEFTVLGIPCLGLNGGPNFRHSEAFSFQVATDTQSETDRYWNAIVVSSLVNNDRPPYCPPQYRNHLHVAE
jgi:predicted 3-demethylubiquinone-9 3-methyltransferase (glyoxalase superfamily)